MRDELTMVVTDRFCDGSGGSQTHVGDRAALAAAFATHIPTANAVREVIDTLDARVSWMSTRAEDILPVDEEDRDEKAHLRRLADLLGELSHAIVKRGKHAL